MSGERTPDMTRATLLLVGIALAVPAFAADKAAPKPTYVLVDPADLRMPVPDPEQGLTEKYDGKVVRFTAVVRRSTLDKKTKKYHYELHYDITHKTPAKGDKRAATTKETIVVPVTFAKEEKELQKELEKRPRGKDSEVTITVEGKGSVLTDGTLLISDAVIIREERPFSRS